MGLSLRGTTSGAIDINPPAVAGDNAITLPASNGSANQFFKNSGTAGIVTYSSMVENSGKIGIGTAQPVNNFQVGIDTTSFNITSDGLVGIGTTDPNVGGRLSVVVLPAGGHGAINIQNHEKGSGKTNIVMRSLDNNGGNWAIAEHRAEGYSFKIRTTERVRITYDGYVGIGQTNPAYLLDVKTTGNEIGRFETTSTADLAIELKNSQGSMFFGLGGGEEFAVATTSNLNGASDNLFAIKQDGKVGINQVNPAALLHVSGGNIRVDSGYGIDFAATTDSSGTMSSEVLDDYEEGTWTPEYKTSSGGSSGISHYTQSGTYVKIGKLVYIELLIATSDWSSGVSGDIEIQNLPFAMKDTSGAAFNIAFRREWNSNIGENLLGRLTNISDVPSIIFYKNASNSSGTTRVVHTDFMDGSHENYIYGAGWYQVP